MQGQEEPDNYNGTTVTPNQWAYVAWSWLSPCPVDGAPVALLLCGSPAIVALCQETGAGDLWYHTPPSDKLTGVYHWSGHIEVSNVDETDVNPVGGWVLDQEYDNRLNPEEP